MARTFSAEEIAAEAGIAQDRLAWLVSIGIVRPQQPGAFRFGDVFRTGAELRSCGDRTGGFPAFGRSKTTMEPDPDGDEVQVTSADGRIDRLGDLGVVSPTIGDCA